MGHNLGLGHSNMRSAIMYPSGVNQDETALSSDDLRGIQSLYGPRNGKVSSWFLSSLKPDWLPPSFSESGYLSTFPIKYD